MRKKSKNITKNTCISIHFPFYQNRYQRMVHFRGLFLTSSSLHACNINLFGCPGVIPEWPFDQSYEIA